MKRRSPLLIAGTSAAVLALVGPLAAAHAATNFTGGPLPVATGISIPRNEDGEPGAAVDGAGTFWIGSDIAPYAANDPRAATAISGEDIWKSTDNGVTYQFVADPFATAQNTRPGLGGEDSDIAAAPVKNTAGNYNVYAVSLYVANTTAAISQDGGATWTLDQLSGIPAQDRPWVAADGACTFYVSYHQLPSFTPFVNKYDLCTPGAGVGNALNPVQSTSTFAANGPPGLTNAFNKIVVDTWPGSPHLHTAYQPMEGCDLQTPQDFVANAESTSGCPGKTEVFIGVSTDGGATFNDYRVATGTNNEIPVWPGTVAVDSAGTVYYAWSDNHVTYLDVSHDAGQTWSAPVQINQAPSVSAVEPTVAGGSNGNVVVAWYGTSVAGDANDATVMGAPNAAGAAQWYLYSARSADSGASFSQQQASDVVHVGELCTQGSNCSTTNSRNLLDDFGVAISPATGTASIAYTDDQPQGLAGTTFTAYATETTPVQTPEAPYVPLLLVIGTGLVVVSGTAMSRRRRSGAPLV